MCPVPWPAAGLLLALAAAPAPAGSGVQGHFTAGDCRLEPTHVYAFETPARGGDAAPGTLLVLTTRPLEVGLEYSFDPRQSALEALTGKEPRAEMGLVATVAGGTASYFFWCGATQTSGSDGGARLTVQEDTDRRFAAVWTTPERGPESQLPSWDLRVTADVADPMAAARPLPEGGGEPGRAYLRYLEDLRKGDVAALRRFIDNPYYLAEDATAAQIAEDLEGMRGVQPKSAVITKGMADAGAAILHADATMYDGTRKEQRVLLKRAGDRWVFGDFSRD